MDKAQPIRLNHFHENDGGRAKNGTQPKQYGPQCIWQIFLPYRNEYETENNFQKIEAIIIARL